MEKVVVSLYGGLGNQLFQYATGLTLAESNQANLSLDLTWFETVQHKQEVTTREYALKPFELDVSFCSIKPRHPLLSAFAKRMHLSVNNTEGVPIYYERSYVFDPAVMQLTNNVHLDGYWQSYRYFESVKSLLQQKLTNPRSLDSENESVLADISQNESICVHVRRGDYVTNNNAAKHHGTCSLAYYQKAIKKMEADYPNGKFYIFSDDINWAKGNLLFDQNHYFVDQNSAGDVHFDFWLMAACNHFIIANSSLSWWAAWLAGGEQKTVISPKNWFSTSKNDPKDLIPPEWYKIV